MLPTISAKISSRVILRPGYAQAWTTTRPRYGDSCRCMCWARIPSLSALVCRAWFGGHHPTPVGRQYVGDRPLTCVRPIRTDRRTGPGGPKPRDARTLTGIAPRHRANRATAHPAAARRGLGDMTRSADAKGGAPGAGHSRNEPKAGPGARCCKPAVWVEFRQHCSMSI